jgi:hypothetical protein
VSAARTVARARPDGTSIGQPGGSGAITVAAPPVRFGFDDRMTEVRVRGNTDACTSEPATRVGIVYRDRAALIVGGAVATTADVGQTVAFSGCMVGGFAGGVYAYGPVPAGTDDSRTEVALYCDPAKPVRPTFPPME